VRASRGVFCALLLGLIAVGCSGTSGERDPVRIAVEEGPNSVLTAVVQVDADEPVLPVVAAVGPDGHRIQPPAPEEPARHHEFALLGMRPDQEYTITVDTDAAGAGAGTIEDHFTAGPLPEDLPEVIVDARPDARPGFTLFNASAGDQTVAHPGNLIAVDETGAVVWYHQSQRSLADVRQLPNGNLLANHASTGALEIDPLGNVVNEWTTTARVDAGRFDEAGEPFYGEDAIVLDTIRLHHEVAHLLPSGNFLALGMEVRDVAGFDPDLCGADDPLPDGPRPLRGDIVIEYSPEGEIVKQLPLLDAVDPIAVPGVAICETRTDPFVEDGEPYVDWTHGNSAEVFADENLVLVSARHLNQILALRWETDDAGPAGEVLWSLGAGGDFELTEGEWFVEQHAPEWLDASTILVYDNGTDRPGTTPAGGSEAPYSRAVIYEIALPQDGRRGTARQVWEHRMDGPDGQPEYASFLGDADLIGDGHVLITHGAIEVPEADNYRARIIEVVRESDEIVLDINLPAGDVGWRSYRAEHLDSLYPSPTPRN
jgi:hypothetical protein